MVVDSAVLAYVFWHTPAAGAGGDAYEDALRSFHDVLADDPPAGFLRSVALRVSGAPWLPGGAGYEDWYLVRDFAALGTLNEAAVVGRRSGPHDDVALRSGHGAGGVYAPWTGSDEVPAGEVTWFAKAPGAQYRELRAAVPGTAWQRQLVLGPAPEFCLVGGATPAGAVLQVVTRSEVVWPTTPATRRGP